MHPILNTCWLEDLVPLRKCFKKGYIDMYHYIIGIVNMLSEYNDSEADQLEAELVIADLDKHYETLREKYGNSITF